MALPPTAGMRSWIVRAALAIVAAEREGDVGAVRARHDRERAMARWREETGVGALPR